MLVFFLVLVLLGYSSLAQTGKKAIVPSAKAKRSYTLLPLGDSITEGGSSFSSYLYPLWEQLFTEGYQVEFIGPNNSPSRIGGIAHAGFGGKTTEFLAQQIDSIYHQYPADIVLLHSGHNHFSEEKPIAQIIEAQSTIIHKIKRINPDAIIMVAQVIESGKLPKYAYLPSLNAATASMVKTLEEQYDGLYLVDQATGFLWKEHTVTDKVHPNKAGAEIMAKNWFNALREVLKAPKWSLKPTLVTYKEVENRDLKLHIFTKKPGNIEKKKPCILFFFGGGWKVGSPLQFYRECAHFAEKGFVAISADYRIDYLDKSTIFDCISDAKSAVRWVRENAEELGIDADKIAVAGASAGGYLAAATATVDGYDKAGENLVISSRPNLNILYYPVIDNAPGGYGSDEMKANYKAISPLYCLDQEAPPSLILLGSEDPYLSVNNAEKYIDQLKAFGIKGKLKVYRGAGHPIFYYRKGVGEAYFHTLRDTEAFLKKQGYFY
ncbi:alpha/beta hydrolase fold domain-containing protein [Echinicola marina]|uniref:alpha/beta hydrolase fold domain-containing protein n=1 Tax=Echinicola marina TaxID=2859768 RepID=UPI001CF672F2|nr:alpha/beta hydrolase fold domain-containing protein [Echinicola marina]UCS92081.1 alpha/beta hydrolase fold domain-containing protein [Echinicola marina]